MAALLDTTWPKPYTQPASTRKPHMEGAPREMILAKPMLLQRVNWRMTSTRQPNSWAMATWALALIPWAVVKLFTGEYGYAVGLIVLYVLTQGIRQVIQPKIVGDSMGLPPLATLFFLYLGFKFRGIAGMIIAVPIGILFIRFYEYGAFDGLIRNVKLLAEEIRKLMEG